MSSIYEASLKLHAQLKGKLAIIAKHPLKTREDLSLLYTPGVAAASREIAKEKESAYTYTMKGNTIAVITDGTAVLGLGNIGPEAALPVMEGKCLLFKELAGIDAVPLCLNSKDPKETIAIIKALAPTFGGINLEDIKAPECFMIEESLQDLGIPVMHDDQHGTAVVVLAAVINATKVVKKNIKGVKIVINGAGAAGIAITQLLLADGITGEQLILCDSKGILVQGRADLSGKKLEMARLTNTMKKKGLLTDAVRGADIVIGVSVKGALTTSMVQTMAKDAIIIAMANPDPEILPQDAKAGGAAIVATGRSDFPNQVNNVLGFPGIFRGALDARAHRITTAMKLAAAEALASAISTPTKEQILPSPLDKQVVLRIAEAVKKAVR
ncbi:NADP-dependent malic enzyme [Candidatus Woesearchaeota archaeon]|nr:NADP-dependent malic enzyme [Candidatus Woesearchaeota archaeon]